MENNNNNDKRKINPLFILNDSREGAGTSDFESPQKKRRATPVTDFLNPGGFKPESVENKVNVHPTLPVVSKTPLPLPNSNQPKPVLPTPETTSKGFKATLPTPALPTPKKASGETLGAIQSEKKTSLPPGIAKPKSIALPPLNDDIFIELPLETERNPQRQKPEKTGFSPIPSEKLERKEPVVEIAPSKKVGFSPMPVQNTEMKTEEENVEEEVVATPMPRQRTRKINPMFALEDPEDDLDDGFEEIKLPPRTSPTTGTRNNSPVTKRDATTNRFVASKDTISSPRYTKPKTPQVEFGEWSKEDRGTEYGLGGEIDKTKKNSRSTAPFRLTERDILIIRFLARYRFAHTDTIARLANTSPRTINNRLSKLEKNGMVRSEKIVGNVKIWLSKKDGNALADVPFKEIQKGRVSYVTLAHTIGLASIAAELERETREAEDLLGEGRLDPNWQRPMNRWKYGVRGHPEGRRYGEMTISEREVRQAQLQWRGDKTTSEMRSIVDTAVKNPDGPELEEGNEGLFVVYGTSGGEHIPDMVISRERGLDGSPQNIAIELELTEKGERDWARIIRNFRDNGHIYKKVYYFTHKKKIFNKLSTMIEKEGLSDYIYIRKFIPIDGTMPSFGG